MYYQESRNINLTGFVTAYLISIISAIFLGYIYSVIILVNPVSLGNLFLVIGLGLSLGFLNRLITRLTHNRFKKSQLIQGFIIGLLVITFRWINHITHHLEGEISNIEEYISNLSLIFKPTLFFHSIIEINKFGYEFYVWPGGSILGKFTMSGFSLTLAWIFEILIIISISVLDIYKGKIYPYSEYLGKWYPKYVLFKDFESISTVNQLQKDLQVDALYAIQKLGKGNGFRHSKIYVFYLNDEDKQYLTFEKVFVEGQGKGKKKRTILINNFKIDKKTADSIFDNYEHRKEKNEII